MEVNPAQRYESKLLVLYDSSPIVLFVFPCLCGWVRTMVGLGFGFGQERALLLCFCLNFPMTWQEKQKSWIKVPTSNKEMNL